MTSFFPSVIHDCFPNAKIVVDHFHVIQWAIHLSKEEKKVFQEISKETYKINQLLTVPSHKLSENDFVKLEKVFDKVPKLKKYWKIIHQLIGVKIEKSRKTIIKSN